jgi:Transposase
LQRSRTGSRRRGKKGEGQVEREYLDHALAGFSGYIAADELYDGPFCVLSIVDNRNFRRLSCRVLEQEPKAKDIADFLGDFRRELDQRGLALRGITTDASSLYTKPLAQVFAGVAHQICRFHIIKELTRAILRAVAKFRKQRIAQLPCLPRGHVPKAKRRHVARVKRKRQRISDLFENRHVFVRRHLSSSQRRTLLQITRGIPQLRTLRQIMEQVYALFDRRCRSDSALSKLAKLRRRVRQFKKVGKALQRLFSPNLEKALTFLDDKLLPSTSNAVERGNRRHRKMQKSIYRVRTRLSLQHRMALDLLREKQSGGRAQATAALHAARAGSG